MLFSNLKPLITTAILLLGSTVSAHQPMDTSNNMKRDVHPNSILAVRSDSLEFSPRVHPRSIFEKRQVSCNSNQVTCAYEGTSVFCCPSDTVCFKSDGEWKCDGNTLGLTRGQKISIGIGVTVLFFVICVVSLVIFFCCCRKAAQIASAAVNNNNNNNDNPPSMYPPPQPVMYGGPTPGYNPAAVPMNNFGGEQGKPYGDAPTGYYGQPGQAGYEQYGQQPQQQQQYQQPHAGFQPSPSPAPPYQQPPPPPPGPPQQYTH